MLLTTQTKVYITANIIPVFSVIVSGGLTLKMYYELYKLQQHEEISGSKIFSKAKKYILLIIIVNILSTVIYLIDSYFK